MQTATKHDTEIHEGHMSHFARQLTEAEALTNELKRILVRSEQALAQEGIRDQVETLERWMESYRRGLSAANKMSTAGAELLGTIRNRLHLATEELQRLEGEGGNPATSDQSVQMDELVGAMRRIDRMIPDIRHMFCGYEDETAKPTE